MAGVINNNMQAPSSNQVPLNGNRAVAGRYGYVTIASPSGVASAAGFRSSIYLPLDKWKVTAKTDKEDVTNFTSDEVPVFAGDIDPNLGTNTWREFTTLLSEASIEISGKLRSDWRYLGLGMPNGSVLTIFLGFRFSRGPGGSGDPRFIAINMLVESNDIDVDVQGVGTFAASGCANGAPYTVGF